MRRLSAEAFVLDVVDLHDRDRIVTFLTSEWGCKRGVTRGARTKYSRFAGQLQPLANAHVGWFEKEGRDLVRIEQVELLQPCRGLLDDLEGILLASYLAEHMVQFAQENEDSELLYRLLSSTLAWLEGGVDRDLVTRYYEIWVLRLGGIFPAPRDCPSCGRDLSQVGAVLLRSADEIVCESCGSLPRAAVSAAALSFLGRTRDAAPPSLCADRTAPKTLREVEKICAQVRRGFLQQELRSYEVMKATLELEGELARV